MLSNLVNNFQPCVTLFHLPLYFCLQITRLLIDNILLCGHSSAEELYTQNSWGFLTKTIWVFAFNFILDALAQVTRAGMQFTVKNIFRLFLLP